MKPTLQHLLRQYANQGGSLLVSGAYVGSDMKSDEDKNMLAEVLKCQSAASYKAANDSITGMGTTFDFYHQMNEEHYAATAADVINPVGKSFAAMRYADGQTAAVAYQGNDYRALTMGFPFECIKSDKKRNTLMRGMINFLINRQ